MQILIPISSESKFFPKEEFYFPKPLIEVAGQPMIELVISQLRKSIPQGPFYIFVVGRDEARAYSLDRTLVLAAGESTTVVERIGDTSGALCSCLLAIDSLDLDRPLIISNSDQIISSRIEHSITRLHRADADAGVITFDNVHPRWSYVVADKNHTVLQTFEKKVVSRHAIAGLYYFRSARIF